MEKEKRKFSVTRYVINFMFSLGRDNWKALFAYADIAHLLSKDAAVKL